MTADKRDYLYPPKRRDPAALQLEVARLVSWLTGTAAFFLSMFHAISQASAVVIIAYLALTAVTVGRGQ